MKATLVFTAELIFSLDPFEVFVFMYFSALSPELLASSNVELDNRNKNLLTLQHSQWVRWIMSLKNAPRADFVLGVDFVLDEEDKIDC